MKITNNNLIAIDIEGLADSKHGQRLVNGLMSSKGVLYRTKRGRAAIQVRPDAVERLAGQLKFDLVDGFDGTRNVTFREAEESSPFFVL